MPLLVGWGDDGCSACARSAAAAEAFAAPVLWRHAGPLPPGRTLSSAHDAGIASIYAEASGGGGLSRSEADAYAAGVRRVMASLGMLALAPADAPSTDPPLRLVGEGDLDVPAMVAPFDGLCETLVGPLDRVRTGEVVAIVTDPIDRRARRGRARTGTAWSSWPGAGRASPAATTWSSSPSPKRTTPSDRRSSGTLPSPVVTLPTRGRIDDRRPRDRPGLSQPASRAPLQAHLAPDDRPLRRRRDAGHVRHRRGRRRPRLPDVRHPLE